MSIPNLPPINDEPSTPTPAVEGKVIQNADTRRIVGNVLWTVSILAAVASLFLSFFPEVSGASDIPLRGIAFANALVSLLTGAFGLVVVRPNTGNTGDASIR